MARACFVYAAAIGAGEGADKILRNCEEIAIAGTLFGELLMMHTSGPQALWIARKQPFAFEVQFDMLKTLRGLTSCDTPASSFRLLISHFCNFRFRNILLLIIDTAFERPYSRRCG